MTDKLKTEDIILTKDHFDSCDLSIIDKNCESLLTISNILASEANNNDNGLTDSDRRIFSLFSEAALFVLQSDSPSEPYQANIRMADGSRSALPCDWIQSDIDFLVNIICEVMHSLLKARLADLLWVYAVPKKPTHARIAIDCYISSGIELHTWLGDVENYYNRAYRLSKTLNDIERQNKIENLVYKAFLSDQKASSSVTLSIAEFIEKFGMLKNKLPAVATRLKDIGEKLVSSKEFSHAAKFFEIASKKYRQISDEQENIQMSVRVAECYASEADENYSSGKGRQLISIPQFKKAISAYYNIPNNFRDEYSIDKRISELGKKLIDAGKNAVNEMSSFTIPIEGAAEIIKHSEEFVANKTSGYEALLYFSKITPLPNYKSLVAQEKENLKKYFFSSLFRSSQFSQDGRIVKQTPASADDPDAALKDNIVRSFNFTIDFNVSLIIIPALRQIIYEHTISKRLISEMCYYSPLVPNENIQLISHAVWLGFEFDFANAIFIIAPQIEKMVRVQLKSKGAHTTHKDKDIEHEKGLSTLLEMPEAKDIFDENLLFELKAIFTDSIGPNLRNEVAHGILTDSVYYSKAPIYAWWMVLRMIIHSNINISEKSEGNLEPTDE